ncbi:hypothetical protein Tco_0631383 [Tanacetum coccineum]
MMDADYQMAQQLQTKEQEQLSIEENSKLFVQLLEARKKHFAEMRAREKRNKPPTQSQQRKLYCNYLKNMEGYTLKQFEKKAEDSTKRVGTELEQEVAKKQKIDDDKLDDDQEEARMKEFMNIVPDEEEVAINAIPLATKPSCIVKAKHGSTRPEKGYERVLWGDLMTIFEPNIESPVWRTLQNEKVLIWKLFDSCGVHFLRLQSMDIFMLVEKRYPLTPATITEMLNKKLQTDHLNEMCYQLLKLMTKQLKNPESGRIVGIKSFIRLFGITATLIKVSAAQEERLGLLTTLMLLVYKLLQLVFRVNAVGTELKLLMDKD